MAQLTIQQVFDQALRHHQAGRLQEAERLYRVILAHQPEHADAMHYLGVIAQQFGRNDTAVDLIRRAIALNPHLAGAHNNLGNALTGNGQLDEAIAAYRQAIALKPNYAEAHNNLGNALAGKGRIEEAIISCRRAIALKPNLLEAHNNLGNALRDREKFDEAIAAYRQVLVIKPNYAEAHNNLGIALAGNGQLDEAIASFRQAIAIRTNYAEAHNNLGNALRDKGHLDEAIGSCRRALAIKTNYAEAHNNLGNALADQGQLDEAVASYRQAIALKPDYAEAYHGLGVVLTERGRLDETVAAYRQAIALKPSYAEAHFNLALTLLAQGDFEHGWQEYEWLWKCKGFRLPPQNFTQPRWDGRPLEGRTILLHAEQGYGDALQFIRYLPLVAQRGGRIIIQCQAELQRLFQAMAEGCQVVGPDQPLPAFEFHSPLPSLPPIFGTTLANIPNIVPYPRPDAENAEKWRQRLADHSPFVKVGLVWAGSANHKNDRNRSMKLARFVSLGQIPGMRFFSLQKGDAAAESKTPPAGLELIDWTQELKDFADTAALIANLDVVIAVDTAVAHLAGAMGKPVWTLLPFSADWRWLLERDDSPWYPSMRLFRQPAQGDWDSVIARVAEALSLWISRATVIR